METPISFQEPDEARPAKKARLDSSLELTEETREEMVDDASWDDIYDDDTQPSITKAALEASAPTSGTQNVHPVLQLDAQTQSVHEPREEQPPPTDPTKDLQLGVHEDSSSNSQQTDSSQANADTQVPLDALDAQDEFVADKSEIDRVNEPNVRMVEQTSATEIGAVHQHQDEHELEQRQTSNAAPQNIPQREASLQPSVEANGQGGSNSVTNAMPTTSEQLKATDDTEFMAAAAAQKDNTNAEWQFNSSDAESSSDSDTSDSDSSSGSDSGSDGGYEMLDPATAAKILMQGDGDDDDGNRQGKSGADLQPRTANEVKEVIVPKPDVTITNDMKVVLLGHVERAVENMILVRANTTGEYQVLEEGSVLCNEKKEVVGSVSEPLGRVTEPMYCVMFSNAKEVEDFGLGEYGAKVFYIEEHSKFVFTQPLKGLKGTDASNIHDEEVGEDEAEFSDDEKEAEYKRQKKLAKRGAKAGNAASRGGSKTFGAPGHNSGTTMIKAGGFDAPVEGYGGGMDYDDGGGDVEDEFYKPLQRPDNLAQMMAGPPHSLPPRRGSSERGGRGHGRGDFRGRGRGDRGRGGRGSFHDRGQRGGRGGPSGQSRGGPQVEASRKGPANSYPDKHNNGGSNTAQGEHLNASRQQQPHQQQPSYQPYQQPYQQPQAYQFNGYTFQYGSPAPQSQAAAPQNQIQQHHQQPQQQQQQFSVGAYVNPTFWQSQQAAGSIHPQPPAQWQNWTGQGGVPQVPHVLQGGQQGGQQQQPQSQPNLADIMRQFSGPQS
ncbi:NAF1-domain-containing protein [Polychaeton citri CBS 116435]|uniref:H/ACA ribonucleoprotein complex non-core subunit NAF1 n=1 Tax=Polychaeton citri CBS 116435 TaxID=1314669 RepID=A0A9P4QD79_9PEZI|nr:NAF1-domain-containing protein [Polychaeton citri CBS 116435]